MTGLNIGVLAVQGDVAENIHTTQDALKELDESGTVQTVKTPEQIAKLDGLIIPGGESRRAIKRARNIALLPFAGEVDKN